MDGQKHAYTAQKVKFQGGFTLVNYHGYYKTDPLGDETTVKCMSKVADLLRNEPGPVVMCGDLNVIAESPAMRELDFLRDLTVENNVKTTLRNIRFVKDVACDHILISGGIACHEFKVIDARISDHRALSAILELDS